MKETKTIQEVMQEMTGPRHGSPQLVRDWRSMIPEWSRWNPGDPGNPNCRVCEGTGYLRLEGLPVGHKYFGQMIFCECVDAQKIRERKAMALNEDYGKVPAGYR